MRKYIIPFFLLTIFLFPNDFAYSSDSVFDHSYKSYAKILANHVNNGLVNYEKLKSNKSNLDDVLSQFSKLDKEDYNSFTQNEKLAFLINLYNAQTLKLIINNYPINSIKDIGKPWDLEIVDYFNSKISLNHLEHEIIRKEFNEPRIHFALVCAAKGCPILSDEPYRESNLSSHLETSTSNFLKDSEKNYIDKNSNTIYLSSIFNWFEKDFVKKSGSVAKFIEPYFPKETDLENIDIKYTNYDWSLNDSK